MGQDIYLGGLCYFLFTIVLCFAQEHRPNWLGIGIDIVSCLLLSQPPWSTQSYCCCATPFHWFCTFTSEM